MCFSLSVCIRSGFPRNRFWIQLSGRMFTGIHPGSPRNRHREGESNAVTNKVMPEWDLAESCQLRTLCSWRNKCLSPEGESRLYLTACDTMKVTTMATKFSIFKSSRGYHKCLMAVFISESYLKDSQCNSVCILYFLLLLDTFK